MSGYVYLTARDRGTYISVRAYGHRKDYGVHISVCKSYGAGDGG